MNHMAGWATWSGLAVAGGVGSIPELVVERERGVLPVNRCCAGPRDLNGEPISLDQAAELAAELAVPHDIRAQRRGYTRRGRLNPT